jgi:hypothetical protein
MTLTRQDHDIADQIAKVIAENIVETSLGQYIYVWQFISDLIAQVDRMNLNYEGGSGLKDKVQELYENHKESEGLPNGFFVKFPATTEKEMLRMEKEYTKFLNDQGRMTDKQHLAARRIGKKVAQEYKEQE